MAAKKLVIFGAGKLAELACYYFTSDSDYEVAAFTVTREFHRQETFLDLPVVPFESIEKYFSSEHYDLFVAVGYKIMRNRDSAYGLARSKGYSMPNYISSRAIVHDNLIIGRNNFVMPNVHIEPFVTLGNNNLFWSDTLVCHDVSVGDHNYVAAKSTIGGESRISDLCFIGNGSTIINNIIIAVETHVIPGATIFEDTEPYSKFIGCPARKVGSHKETGIIIERG